MGIKEGDKVAVVAPSMGCASLFPWVYEQGLKRLRETFKLIPVEYPSARQTPEFLSKNPKARAEDINQAFADPEIKAIIATIGGLDAVRILPFLDENIIRSNPKPFFGYSDCTNLHLYLWKLGMVSYYGGMIMTQYGMQGRMHNYTVQYLKKALFKSSLGQIEESPVWTDFDYEWADQSLLSNERPLYPSFGWEWHNPKQQVVQGKLWGGCLELLNFHLTLKKHLPSLEQFDDVVLYVETSEEMPPDGLVYRFFASLGELGILPRLKALLVAIPKAQFCGREPPEGRTAFIQNQQAAIKKALSDYSCHPLTLFNLNFGHTDPQFILPNGGLATLDPLEKTLYFH
jgi:muramoyltetrapeptide carboxypeptidase LdcA involved in peptidoglycan recycling